MLIGINELLIGDLLKALSNMGHGDEIVIADGNYSATADATQRPPIWLPGYDTLEIVRAILEVFPLDETAIPAWYITEDPSEDFLRAHHHDFQETVETAMETHGWGGKDQRKYSSLPRHMFHERARDAHAVVATTDRKHYACYILRKGALSESE